MKNIFLILFFGIQITSIFSQIKFTVSDGLWNDANIWYPMGVPTASDSVYISAGDSVAILGPNAVAKYLRIDATNSRLVITKIPMSPTGGQLEIMNVDGNGVVNYGELIIGGRMDIHDTEAAAIHNWGLLTISQTGWLTIEDSNGPGIDNFGTITNWGTCEIEDVVAHGIKIFSGAPGGYTLINYGEIHITQAYLGGIVNIGFFDNHGTINMDSIRFYGIKNQNQMANHPNATLTMENINAITGVGLLNEYYVNNQGSIQIIDTDSFGVYSVGKFENHHILSLRSNRDHAIFNLDSFINNGTVEVTDNLNAVNGVHNAAGAYFTNQGMIHIDRMMEIGIHNFGLFENHHWIEIKATASHALRNANGSYYNRENGNLICRSTHDGIQNLNGYFENDGKIKMTDIDLKALNNSGLFVNLDSIIIEGEGIKGVENNDSLLNIPGGVLDLRNGTGHGTAFVTSTNSLTTNEGVITLNNYEYGLDVGGHFENRINGDIEIRKMLVFFLQIDLPHTFVSDGVLSTSPD